VAGRIPESFLDTLNDRLNLVDVVSTRMPLKKAGREYAGRCPFHDDSSPSFSVNPDKQVYHCFGCGASGGLISFVMEYDRLDFMSAVESLASLAGLEIPTTDDDPDAAKRRQLYDILDKADRFFRHALRTHSDRARAVDYLKQRGLTGQVAHTYGLGFAPPGWQHMRDTFGTDRAQQSLLSAAGLITSNATGREYDRFRDRVMFPIRDPRGRTIAFGGRVLDASKPKYLNSPETLLFHKSDTLYGLYEARQANRTLERVLVVEGYMDVVALAQYGITYAVATLGTALTGAHLDRLSRQTAQVIVCFDGDAAGKTAAKRALDTMLGFLSDEFSIRFLFLPDGHDPDSLVRDEGKDAFLARLNDALPASEALVQLLSDDVDLTKIDGRARLTALALPKIARVPQSIYRSLMLDALSELSGTRRSDLDARLLEVAASITPEATPKHATFESQPSAPDASETASLDHLREITEASDAPSEPIDAMEEPPVEEVPEAAQPVIFPDANRPDPLCNRIIWLILQDPAALTDIPDVPDRSRLPNVQVLAAICDWLRTTDHPTTPALMGYFSGTEIGRLLSRLLKRDSVSAEGEQRQELEDGINQLKKQWVTEAMHQLAADAKQGKVSVEDLHKAVRAHKN
jgi:DNA primase